MAGENTQFDLDPEPLGDALSSQRRGDLRALIAGLGLACAAAALVGLGVSTGRVALSSSTRDAADRLEIDAVSHLSTLPSGSAATSVLRPDSALPRLERSPRFGQPALFPTASTRVEVPSSAAFATPTASPLGPGGTHAFNGRPIRVAHTLRMRVTAYSPDARSCGASADGITASGYSVETNGGNLVAADPRVLPLGTLVSVPGYDGGHPVQVLDVGGAIKGNRLDVLFPTHDAALRWGVRELDVTIWEYADGAPDGFKRLRRPSK